jgi:hypothetical protein
VIAANPPYFRLANLPPDYRIGYACLTGKPPGRLLDNLMRKLVVIHRLLDAEERLAKRERPAWGGERDA